MYEYRIHFRGQTILILNIFPRSKCTNIEAHSRGQIVLILNTFTISNVLILNTYLMLKCTNIEHVIDVKMY